MILNMTRFEELQKMNIDEFSEWLNQYGNSDFFDAWFANNYCDKCERITSNDNIYAYCELNDECQMCPGNNVMKSDLHIIKMWLSEENNQNNT